MCKKTWGAMIAQFVLTLLLGAALGCNDGSGGGGTGDSNNNSTRPSGNSLPPPPPPPPPPPKCDSAEFKEAYKKLAEAEPEPMDASKVGKWPGLPNVGNRCFLLASLKLFARQRELREKLKVQDEKELNSFINEKGEKKYMPISNDELKNTAELRRAFKVVISMIRLGEASPAKDRDFAECSLRVFDESMKKISGLERLTGCKQEDANEFMGSLSGALNLDKETKENTYANLLAAGSSEDPLAHASFGKVEILAPFSLSVQNPTDEVEKSLSDLLDEFTRFEILSKDNLGIFPGGQARAVKQFYLTGIDQSVIILVGTSLLDKDKKLILRSTLVTAPEKLKLTSYDLPDPVAVAAITKRAELNALMDKTKHEHELNMAAVVVHSGGAGSGHYWAYIKDDAGRWYEHNDSSVSEYKGSVTDIEVDSVKKKPTGKQAYVYLYEK